MATRKFVVNMKHKKFMIFHNCNVYKIKNQELEFEEFGPSIQELPKFTQVNKQDEVMQ